MQTAWKKERELVLEKNHTTAEKNQVFLKYIFLLITVETFWVMRVSLMKTTAKRQIIKMALNQVIDWQI